MMKPILADMMRGPMISKDWLLACGLMWFCGLRLFTSTTMADDGASLLSLEQQAFTAAAERAAACVVQIETFGGLERVGEELLAEGPTTGTIIAADGWVVSSLYSLRQKPASILVKLPSGERVAARIVARDFSRELALLKVDTTRELTAAMPAEMSQVQVGQWSLGLGKTYDADTVSQSVGIISALGRAYGKAVQTDAKVSPINYGGPLVNLRGEVIGILSPLSPGAFFEGNSADLYDSGIGFAVPLADILQRLPKMQAGEDIHPGKLGIVPSDQNEQAGPVRLTGAAPGSPAAKAGVRNGDVIVEAGGNPVRLLADLRHAIAQVDAGQILKYVVERDGQRLRLESELALEIPVYRRRYLGLRLIDTDAGPQIAGIVADSPASRADGLSVGATIVACNDQPIQTREQLAKILAVAEIDIPLTLKLSQGGSEPAQQVSLRAEEWPAGVPAELPELGDPPSGAAAIAELALGDVPNKAFVIKPAGVAERQLGLLLFFPEPGELDQQKTLEHWQDFCNRYGWLVAVIQSGNPKAWSPDDVELAGRVLSRLDQSFRVDPLRTAVGGWGVGGRVAMAAGLLQRKRVQGVVTFGTDLRGLKLESTNAPGLSLNFLFAGSQAGLTPVAEMLIELGYAADVIDAMLDEAGKWEQLPMDKLTRWLEGLGRL